MLEQVLVRDCTVLLFYRRAIFFCTGPEPREMPLLMRQRLCAFWASGRLSLRRPTPRPRFPRARRRLFTTR